MVMEVQKATVPSCCCLSASSLAVMGSRGDPHHVCASVAVVRFSFQICLSLQLVDVACSGHSTPSWNKYPMPNNPAASGCFAVVLQLQNDQLLSIH